MPRRFKGGKPVMRLASGGHLRSPCGRREPGGEEPAQRVAREFLVAHPHGGFVQHEAPQTVGERGRFGEAVLDLRRSDFHAVFRVAPRFALGECTSDDEAGDGQRENEWYCREVSRGRKRGDPRPVMANRCDRAGSTALRWRHATLRQLVIVAASSFIVCV